MTPSDSSAFGSRDFEDLAVFSPNNNNNGAATVGFSISNAANNNAGVQGKYIFRCVHASL